MDELTRLIEEYLRLERERDDLLARAADARRDATKTEQHIWDVAREYGLALEDVDVLVREARRELTPAR